MPIDPSIILRSGQGVTPVNSPQEAEAQALKLRQMRQATVMGNQEMALRQATIEDRQLETAKRARELAGNDALAASVKKHATADQESGDISVDYQGVANDLSAAGFGQLASSWLKMQNENAEALDKLSSARRAHAKEQLSTIGDLAYRSATADDFTASVALAAAHGLVTEEQAHNIVGQVQEAGGEAWQTVAGHYKQFSPAYQTEQAARAKPVTVAPGARVVVPGTNEVLAEGGPRPSSYVSENKLVDGKPAVVDHDSTTGKYYIDQVEVPAARIKPIPSAAQTVINNRGTLPPGNWEKTGDDFLASIPAQWRTTVKKIAAYDEDPTKVASMRGGMRETLMQWVNQVNPAYDASMFTNRAPTRKAFTTGTQGQQINAINTAIGHIDQLTALAEKMGTGSFVPGNAAFNTIRTMFGSDKVTNFDTLKDALAGEVSSVLSKGAATVSGIAEAKEKIKGASSPQQLAGYVKTLIPVLGSKLSSLDYQYHQAMGESDTFSALSPDVKKILEKHGFDPKHPTINDDKQLTDGRERVIGPNGETGTVPAGTALPAGWRKQ